jgi:hypothetical protein
MQQRRKHDILEARLWELGDRYLTRYHHQQSQSTVMMMAEMRKASDCANEKIDFVNERAGCVDERDGCVNERGGHLNDMEHGQAMTMVMAKEIDQWWADNHQAPS